jgi:biotin operon repressor
MKEQMKGLQRFTDYESENPFGPRIAALLEKIGKNIPITREDTRDLTPEEVDKWSAILTEMLNSLEGAGRDKFIATIDAIISPETRRQIWEMNQGKIGMIINRLIQDNNRMPSVQEIARESGLSRPTVNKHIKEFQPSGESAKELERFRFMAPTILAQVYKCALRGDMRAAKLYFDVVSNPQPPQHIRNQQNNFITFNGMQITEEAISRLPEGQRNQLQKILHLAAQPIHAEQSEVKNYIASTQ